MFDACRRSGCRAPSPVLARHRQSRPRSSLAPHPRRAGRLRRRLRSGDRRLPSRLDARPYRRLFRRLGRLDRVADRRRLDGVSAGSVRHPAGGGAGYGLEFRHHRHRGHRLDAVLPRGARRGDGPGAMDYVENARIAGFSRLGIMLREVLPNVLPSIVALLSLEMGIAVIVEAILSFVNLSSRPTTRPGAASSPKAGSQSTRRGGCWCFRWSRCFSPCFPSASSAKG